MTRIKICGITNAKDALLAVESGAHALGFVFTDSPRQVTPQAAREVIRRLPPFITTVGVFADERQDVIEEVFHSCRLSVVQLHGNEDPEYLDTLSVPLLKAFRVADDRILEKIQEYNLTHFLLDTFDRRMAGGTGKKFDWSIARRATQHGNVVLSGGLNPGNVKEALRVVHPYAVDVSSGVEAFPGRKDKTLLQQFIHEVF